jgi:ribose transport system permease protein
MTDTGDRQQVPRRLNFGLERLSGLYLWALFIVIFGTWKPNLFLTSATAHSVASEEAVLAILAIALMVPMACGAFDLSIGATIGLSTVIVTWLQSDQHWGMWPSIVVAIAASAVIGAINGFIVVKLQVTSFIATIGMATVIEATQAIITQSQPLPPTSSAWTKLTQTTVFGFQAVVFYMIVIAIIFWWVLEHTPVGRYIYAVGGNSEAARLSGVPVGKWTWISLIISSTVAGVAGVLYGSQSGPSLSYGAGLLLPAFAAVFLGSTQFTNGRVNVRGTVLAVYVLATGVVGLQFVTGAQWLNDMFNGVALILAVAFAAWRARVGNTRRRRERRPTRQIELDQETPDPVGASVPDISAQSEPR